MPKNLDSPYSSIPVRVAESMVMVGGEAQRSRLGKANAREANEMKRNAVFIVKEEAEMRSESMIPPFLLEPDSLRQIETIPTEGH